MRSAGVVSRLDDGSPEVLREGRRAGLSLPVDVRLELVVEVGPLQEEPRVVAHDVLDVGGVGRRFDDHGLGHALRAGGPGDPQRHVVGAGAGEGVRRVLGGRVPEQVSVEVPGPDRRTAGRKILELDGLSLDLRDRRPVEGGDRLRGVHGVLHRQHVEVFAAEKIRGAGDVEVAAAVHGDRLGEVAARRRDVEAALGEHRAARRVLERHEVQVLVLVRARPRDVDLPVEVQGDSGDAVVGVEHVSLAGVALDPQLVAGQAAVLDRDVVLADENRRVGARRLSAAVGGGGDVDVPRRVDGQRRSDVVAVPGAVVALRPERLSGWGVLGRQQVLAAKLRRRLPGRRVRIGDPGDEDVALFVQRDLLGIVETARHEVRPRDPLELAVRVVLDRGEVGGVVAAGVAVTGDVHVAEDVERERAGLVVGPAGAVVSDRPEALARRAVLDRHEVGAGSRSRALSGDVDVAGPVHGERVRVGEVVAIAGPVVDGGPLLRSGCVELDDGDVAVRAGAGRGPGDVDVAGPVHDDRVGDIVLLRRAVIAHAPLLDPGGVVLDDEHVAVAAGRAARDRAVLARDVDVAGQVHGDGIGLVVGVSTAALVDGVPGTGNLGGSRAPADDGRRSARSPARESLQAASAPRCPSKTWSHAL